VNASDSLLQGHSIFLAFAVVFIFAIHAFLEALVHIAKYSLYDDAPFSGMVYANATAIVSRVFFTAGGTMMALFIELNGGRAREIIFLSIALLAASGGVTAILVFQTIARDRLSAEFTVKSFITLLSGVLLTRNSQARLGVKGLPVAPISFLNVSAFVFVFVIAAEYPEYRLTIVSVSPIVSMIGTVFITIFFEPEIANRLSKGRLSHHSALSLVLHVRLFGYLVAIILLFALYMVFDSRIA
jgi:hypothetical protein